MTEKELLHKKERKRKRRLERIKNRTPEQEEKRILAQVDAIYKGQQGLDGLYAPLLEKEAERKAQEEDGDGDE